MKQDQAKFIGAGLITAVILIGIYVFVLQSKPADDTITTTATRTQNTPATTDSNATKPSSDTTTSTSPQTKDGTYSAKASYVVPDGFTNNIEVQATVSSGKITGLEFMSDADDAESRQHVDSFEASIKGAVIGKTLDEASQLNRVGGASLTTAAFNQAIRNIANQAS